MHFFEQLISTQIGLVIAFICAAAAVVLSGIRLSVYGDALSVRTGLGSGLIGLIFLAAVTSLPELVVSLTSVIQCADPAQGADLATGNMLGSNIFNLTILALAALFFPLSLSADRRRSSHKDSLIYGLVLLVVFSGAFGVDGLRVLLVPGFACTWGVLLLPIVYLACLKLEHRQQEVVAELTPPVQSVLTQQSSLRFYSTLAALSLVIVLSGVLLSRLGSRMTLPADQGGFALEAGLIGTLFLALSTSLPELVISFSCIRLGCVDMAIGNVLGSNMFNLLIIFAADVALRQASLLHRASSTHWNSVLAIFLLTGLSALLLHTKKRIPSIVIALVMLGLYLAVMALSA